MGAIVLDAKKVNSYVLPNLTKSKNTMQEAYDAGSNLKKTIPGSFKYRSTINDIVNQLYNIKKEINNVSSIISKKIEKSKTIESKNDKRANSIYSLASQIGSIGGTIGSAVMGAVTSGIVSKNTNVTPIKNGQKTIASTGAKVANKVVSGVKKLGTSIIDSFKWVGAKITSSYKSATNWINNKANDVSKWVSEKFNGFKNWTSQALKDTGAWISKTASVTWNWLQDTANVVWTHMQKIGASIVNGVISFVKGLVMLIEAIADFVILLGSGISTIFTALWDVGAGIITGNWDWKATGGLWDGTKSVVAYDCTSNWIFDPLYNTEFGQWLDTYAYEPFKSDGIACEILEGIGYVAGVIAISVLTLGGGAVAMSATAAVGGVGKYTSEEWNKNSISMNYQGIDLDITIDYEKYSEIEKLKQGESTTITHKIILEDGSEHELVFNITSKGNGEYEIRDSDGITANLNNLTESNTEKGLFKATLKGAWEGAQWYVGGQISSAQFTNITRKIASPIMKKLVTSSTRVLLDTGTGVIEVPFQSLVTMMSEGKTWDEAWQSQGGWDAVKSQTAIAGISSFGGETLDLTKLLKNTSGIDINIKNQVEVPKIKIDDLKYKKTNPVTTAVNYLDSNINKYGYTNTNLVEGLNAKAAKKIKSHTSNLVDTVTRTDSINLLQIENTEAKIDNLLFTKSNEITGIDQNILQNMSYEITDKQIILSEEFKNYAIEKLKKMGISETDAIEYTFNLSKKQKINKSWYDLITDYISEKYEIDEAIKLMNGSFKLDYNVTYDLALKHLSEVYGVGMVTSKRILDIIDNGKGACTYAAIANALIEVFADDPIKFKEIFGFDLFIEENGKKILNQGVLLSDIYIKSNSLECGGKMFSIGENGKLDIINLDNTQQLSLYDVFGNEKIDKYLESYGLEMIEFKNISTNGVDYTIAELQSMIQEGIDENKIMTMVVNPIPTNSPPIKFYDIDTNILVSECSSGHAITLLGYDDNGIIVQSWGKVCHIKYEEFLEQLYNIKIYDIIKKD